MAAWHAELLALAPSVSVGINFYGLMRLVNSSPEGLQFASKSFRQSLITILRMPLRASTVSWAT